MLQRYNDGWGNPMIQSHFEDLRRKKAYHEKRNLPLRTIADETGLSVATVQRFSAGTADRFDRKTLEALCRYFGVKSLADLIEWLPDKE